MLEIEATFCYLGDMLCSGGGCDSAIAARWCTALGKFRKLLPARTTRHLSPRYVARCTRPASARLCFMEAKLGDQRKPNCGGSAAITVQWSVGSVASKTKTKHPQLRYYRNLEDITSALLCRQLRWYRHVQRALPCVKSFTNFPLPGTTKKGRSRKTWSECVKTDVDICALVLPTP